MRSWVMNSVNPDPHLSSISTSSPDKLKPSAGLGGIHASEQLEQPSSFPEPWGDEYCTNRGGKKKTMEHWVQTNLPLTHAKSTCQLGNCVKHSDKAMHCTQQHRWNVCDCCKWQSWQPAGVNISNHGGDLFFSFNFWENRSICVGLPSARHNCLTPRVTADGRQIQPCLC